MAQRTKAYRKWLLDRRAAILSFREESRRDAEALKHEVWSCKIGDILEATQSIETKQALGKGFTDVQISHLEPGSRYRAVDLKGRGWDLQPVSGDSTLVRVMNWDIPTYFKIVPQDKPAHE